MYVKLNCLWMIQNNVSNYCSSLADGRQLPFNDRQIVFPNGTLVISDVQRKEDAATYTCMARNDEGYSARSDLEVSVMGRAILNLFILSISELAVILMQI